MRTPRPALVLLLYVLIPTCLLAQQTPSTAVSTSSTPVRDPQAVALVQQSLTAMGGTAVGAILNAQVQGTLTPTASSDVPSGNFTWLDDFSGASFEFRDEVDTTDAVRVEVSGHGSPAVQQGTTINPLRSHVTYTALPYHLPAVLLSREMANGKYSIHMAGPVTVEARPALQVIINSDAGTLDKYLSEQHWDFDAASGLPLRIEYRLPNVYYSDQWVQAAVEFSNYKVVSGLAVPFQVTFFEDSKAVAAATISSVTFNVGTSSSQFDLLTGGAQ